ncbi:hypothetical protein NHQ30_005154 [Ciborinia camelliae]|nr:hypothetical protein NHQ30_005154 [Ciborinia camelliae]
MLPIPQPLWGENIVVLKPLSAATRTIQPFYSPRSRQQKPPCTRSKRAEKRSSDPKSPAGGFNLHSPFSKLKTYTNISLTPLASKLEVGASGEKRSALLQ